jgi:hypothetical protein
LTAAQSAAGEVAQTVRRARPGELPPALWALGPKPLAYRDAYFEPARQPALWCVDPDAVAWLALWEEDLILLGPYGDTAAFGAIADAAARLAHDVGRRAVVAPVRNDEVERFECLQRLGFVLVEARVGALAGDGDGGDERRGWGDIAIRDEFVLARAVHAP